MQQLGPQEREGVMEIVTSWMERGLEKGLEQGERRLLLRQLRKQVGRLDRATVAQIESLPVDRLEELGEALLNFHSRSDLDAWLKSHRNGPE